MDTVVKRLFTGLCVRHASSDQSQATIQRTHGNKMEIRRDRVYIHIISMSKIEKMFKNAFTQPNMRVLSPSSMAVFLQTWHTTQILSTSSLILQGLH